MTEITKSIRAAFTKQKESETGVAWMENTTCDNSGTKNDRNTEEQKHQCNCGIALLHPVLEMCPSPALFTQFFFKSSDLGLKYQH